MERRRVLIVSADAHSGGPPEAYRDYLDPEYRRALEDLEVENREFLTRGITQERYSRAQLELIDERGVIRKGGLLGAWDAHSRLREMDAEGIAAEIVLPGHQLALLPFFGIFSRPAPPELRAAGVRAYHRWLSQLIAASKGRLYGVADAGPCLDMAGTVRELQWVAARGFVSVQPPGFTADPALPPLTDAYYEPFWAACADLGLVITIHVGYGIPQMDTSVFMQAGPAGLPARDSMPEEERVLHRRQQDQGKLSAVLHLARRPLWQLMLSGALDRHPTLKVVLTECRADWVPATLACLDAEFSRGSLPLKCKPSEYW